MALIKDRKPAHDSWQLLKTPKDELPSIPSTGKVIVPLAAWQALRADLIAREDALGVWLSGDEEPADIAADLQHFQVVAVEFVSFTDGRGYSIGRLLRERYGWRGELRAIGDVQRDQLFYLTRCGFNAFDLREGEDVETALTAFDDFREAYQASVDRPLPLFRRRGVQTEGNPRFASVTSHPSASRDDAGANETEGNRSFPSVTSHPSGATAGPGVARTGS